jgi:Na+-translocating ferredoxin:NAD+ oxidoreductase RnfG subunit
MGEPRALVNVLLLAAGCAVVLAATNALTAARIVENANLARRAALAVLVGDASALPAALPDLGDSGIWRLCDGTLLVRSEASGYGGPIELLYTLEAAGDRLPAIRGLTVAAHRETPGIADFLSEADGWLATLRGHDAGTLPGVATLTGATVTTRALREHLATTLAAGASPAIELDCRS